MTDLEQKVANLIGYNLAAMVSRNNMPDMSGDPRARIQPAMRRQFDRACEDAARAAIAICAEEMARAIERRLDYRNPDDADMQAHYERQRPIMEFYAGFIRAMGKGERG